MIQLNILVIAIAAVLIAIVLTAGLSKRISEPIQLLVEGTRQITRGKLSEWVSVKASDEIGELAHAFDAMVHNLKTTTVSRNELVKEVGVRERSEQALRESEDRIRNIIDSALDAVVVMNQEGFITSWNPQAEKIFGWTALEAKQKKMIELILPQDLWGTYNDALKDYIRTGENQWFNKRIEMTAWDYKSRHFPIEAALIPTRFSGGYSFSVFIRDITESKEAQEKLQNLTTELTRSNKELEGFAFVASHDLQEPLRKIVSFGDLLQSEYGKELSAPASEYLAKMQSAAKRMGDFISDLLDYSRITTKAKPFEQLNLNQVIEGVLSDLEMRAKDAKATVEVRPLPEIKADRFQMHQLFQNLIANAMKFRKPGVDPHIIIEGKKDEKGDIEITLQDNGIGFEEKHARRIFGLFMRLHSRSEYEGTGIGLAVCEKIVLRHGGQIEAHGELGKGALFIIKIPAML